MKAVLDMTRVPMIPKEGESLTLPACFFPVMGKPILQHIIEAIERLGVKEVFVYLFDYADAIEEMLGDGERWGVSISYILLKRQNDLLSRIEKAQYLDDDELLLFGTGVVLPQISRDIVERQEEQGFVDSKGLWLQWALVQRSRISTFDLVSEDPSSPVSGTKRVPYLAARSGNEYLRSLRLAMDKGFQGLIVIGQEARKGVWVGPGVRIPKSTTLVPPVYISQQAKIGERDIIGPYVELGHGCVIDDDSLITESAIFDSSYVGKQLDVKRSIINRNQIYNTVIGTVYASNDDIFLTNIESFEGSDSIPPSPVLSRGLALLLFILFSPMNLILFTAFKLSRGRGLIGRECVRLPQKDRMNGPWQLTTLWEFKERPALRGPLISHFLFIFLPGLWSVVRGRVRFCGLQPRSVEEVESMSKTWRELYLSSRLGLITEADILYRDYPDDEMLYATDIFYSVNDSFFYNVRLVGKYIGRLFSNRKRM